MAIPSANEALQEIILQLSFEVGYVKLPVNTLKLLECGDTLLADRLYTSQISTENPIYIRIVLTSQNNKSSFALARLENKYVTVLEAWQMDNQENQIEDQELEHNEFNNTNTQGDFANDVDIPQDIDSVLENLDVTVSFELERRNMSLKDVKTITKGYTFALNCDQDSPVTLRVNGKSIGFGRLVDMDGLMGVEITKLG